MKRRSVVIALLGIMLIPSRTPFHAQQAPAAALPASDANGVIEVNRLRFHSDLWMNLHHTLYAAAWARRPQGGTVRALAGALPSPLDAPLTPDERKTWDAAVDYYDQRIASRDLLFDDGLREIKGALAAGDLSRPSVGPELRGVLESAAGVYRRYFWPAHDRANRAWIDATAEKVRTIAPTVIPRLEKLYDAKWFSSPVRVDIVWVGNRQGGYTSIEPTHVVIASGDSDLVGWTSVEVVFHEVSHALVDTLAGEINRALGDRRRQYGILWHVVQFYVTGSVMEEALRGRGIEYSQYLYSTGLFDRAWPQYRKPVEDNWRPYVEGKVSRDKAIKSTIAALGG
jgi:hypothetical protein